MWLFIKGTKPLPETMMEKLVDAVSSLSHNHAKHQQYSEYG